MVTKIYSYDVLPDKVGEYLDVQLLADKVYSKHLAYGIEHFQCIDNPTRWVEIHKYKNDADALAAEKLSDKEPLLKDLFKRFLSCLVDENAIEQKIYMDRSIR